MGRRVTELQKQLCVRNLVIDVVKMASEDRKSSYEIELAKFLKSRTYYCMNIYDLEYWKEGPVYIYNVYKKEMKASKN